MADTRRIEELSKSDRLRGLVACLESTVAQANREMQVGGYWLSDWGKLMGQYQEQIEDLLGISFYSGSKDPTQ